MFDKIKEFVMTHKKMTGIIGGSCLLVILIFVIVLSQSCGSATINGKDAVKETDSSKKEDTTGASAVTESGTKPEEEKKESEKNQEEATTQEQNHGGSQPEDNSNATPVPTPSTPSVVPGGANQGGLHVAGNTLADANGNPVQLRGLSTHGIAWFPEYVNAEAFRQFHEEFGCNVIRLAMYTHEYNGYCSGGDQNYLKGLVEAGVQYATQNNMYVIIDWHILNEGSPMVYKDQAIAFFNEMSAKYSSYTNVIYEICNEPIHASWDEIRSYALEVIGTIRANDPDGVVIVGTPFYSQNVDQAVANPITEYNNILYAFHYYAATHKEDMRAKLANALASGLPVFVSEFGVCEASGNGAIDEYQAAEWMKLLNQYGVGFCMWNISNKDESSSILSSGCGKYSGFSSSDLSASGKWFVNMMTGGLDLSGEAGNAPQPQPQPTQPQPQPTTNKPAANKVSVQGKYQVSGSWESEGKTYQQLDITVTNNSGSDAASWVCELTFDKKIELQNGWNGTMRVSGNKLIIDSADYNGDLANGASISGIGAIIAK